jgi:hypothetical protein
MTDLNNLNGNGDGNEANQDHTKATEVNIDELSIDELKEALVKEKKARGDFEQGLKSNKQKFKDYVAENPTGNQGEKASVENKPTTVTADLSGYITIDDNSLNNAEVLEEDDREFVKRYAKGMDITVHEALNSIGVRSELGAREDTRSATAAMNGVESNVSRKATLSNEDFITAMQSGELTPSIDNIKRFGKLVRES